MNNVKKLTSSISHKWLVICAFLFCNIPALAWANTSKPVGANDVFKPLNAKTKGVQAEIFGMIPTLAIIAVLLACIGLYYKKIDITWFVCIIAASVIASVAAILIPFLMG